MLLTVKEFGLPLGEPHISAVSAISARIIFTRRSYYVSQKAQITQKGFWTRIVTVKDVWKRIARMTRIARLNLAEKRTRIAINYPEIIFWTRIERIERIARLNLAGKRTRISINYSKINFIEHNSIWTRIEVKVNG